MNLDFENPLEQVAMSFQKGKQMSNPDGCDENILETSILEGKESIKESKIHT